MVSTYRRWLSEGYQRNRMNKNKNRLSKVAFIIAGIVFIISSGVLIKSFYEYYQGDKEYEELAAIINEEYLPKEEYEEDHSDQENTGQVKEEQKNEDKRISKESFEKLSKINPDVVGWIQLENIDVSYPIVQTDNNDYYLNHTFRREANKVGAVFMDYSNSGDFGDPNTFIYGHNMKDGSMFAFLNQYKEESFYKKNPSFIISTPGEEFCYEIFSCYVVSESGDSYVRYEDYGENYGDYLEMIKRLSLYETGVEVNKEDQIVILSTCTRAGDDFRFIVAGKR